MTSSWFGGVLAAASESSRPTEELVAALYPPKPTGRRHVPRDGAFWAEWRVRGLASRGFSREAAAETLVRRFGDAAQVGELDRVGAELDDLPDRMRALGWRVPLGLELSRSSLTPQAATARRQARGVAQAQMFARLEQIECFVVDHPKPAPGLNAREAGRLRQALADSEMQRIAGSLDPRPAHEPRPRGRPRKHQPASPQPPDSEWMSALRAAGVPLRTTPPAPITVDHPWTPAEQEIVEAVLRWAQTRP